MRWLYNLERKLGRFAIPNLMAYICATSLVVYFAGMLGFNLSYNLALLRDGVFAGQIWRLVTFVFVPPSTSVLWILLTLYFYYIIGKGLEDAWGTFKFNVYYVCGMVGIIIASFITGFGSATYLNLTLFLAFAAIYPEHEVRVFYILPVKVKYLAYLDWILLAFQFIRGPGWVRASILLSILNYLIFFGPGMLKSMKQNKQYAAQRRQFRKAMEENQRKNGGGYH